MWVLQVFRRAGGQPGAVKAQRVNRLVRNGNRSRIRGQEVRSPGSGINSPPDRLAHASQPVKMRYETRQHGAVFHVTHAELPASLLHYLRKRWIMNVTDAREQVMFNLKIQAAEQPSRDSAAAGEIDSGFHLMDSP